MARYCIKSLSPPHFKWATTGMRLRASFHCVFSTLMCLLKERCESHHSPRNVVDSSMAEVCFQSSQWGISQPETVVQWNAWLHLWAANLKPFLVAHSCMAFTACCRCLSMVSRERPRKQIARSSTKSALKMSLAIQEGSSLILLQCVAYRTKRYNVDTRDWKTSHSSHLSYWHRIYSQMYEVTPASTSKGKSTTMEKGLSPTLLSHIQWVFLVCNSVAGFETTSVCLH